jgi:predicted nucleic acid-binding Zn ribbon protein
MPPKRPPLQKPMPLGDLIHQFMYQHRPASAEHLARILDVWSLAVGESIARNAKPGEIRGKNLVVYVTNSTWLHQLRFMKTDMIAKLNQRLGSSLVSEIRFKIGAL